ncbi:ABC transporter permease [Kineococcus arenarius]|uniref:ABC transporter permease n=1 Tax=unclassified Kineococcus TaxID=2621656 RepID=UPI003D7E0240
MSAAAHTDVVAVAGRPRTGGALLRTAVAVLVLLVAAGLLGSLTQVAGSPSATIGGRLQPPGAGHLLGTDSLGRSLLPRLLQGITTTLVLSAAAVAVSATVSTALGVVAGSLGGAVDSLVQRVVDVVYSFPALVLAILVAAVAGPGRAAAVVSIVLITVPLTTRMVRTAAAQVAGRDFVTAARIAGLSTPRVLLTHVLPNVRGTVAVQTSYALAVAVLVEGGLSFLGHGVQVPDASLGSLVQDGVLHLTRAPWLALAPGAVLFTAVCCITLVGDGLRDASEPRETRSLT